MPWNTPTDVSTGDNLTSTLWNNQLGANGSLKFVYDELTTTQLKRNVVLYKSTNTVFGAAGNSDIAFDTIISNYGNQQLNFPVTVPITNIPLPAEGMYVITYQYRATAAVIVRSNFFVTTGALVFQYTDTSNTATANVLHSHTIMFFAPATSTTIKLNTQVSAAATITAATPSSTDGSQVLTIARI
jgi:hypothetical protein